MRILALETSTDVCAVQLRTEYNWYERWTEGKGVHSESLFLYINEVLDEASCQMKDIHHLVISAGPGSYTGLRIGVSAVKGLVFGTQIQVWTAQTLASFGYSIIDEVNEGEIVHAIIDARRTHAYHQHFVKKGHQLKAISALDVRELSEINAMLGEYDHLIGSGLSRLSTSTQTVHASRKLNGSGLLKLMEQREVESMSEFIKKVAPEHFEPYYYTSSTPQVHRG